MRSPFRSAQNLVDPKSTLFRLTGDVVLVCDKNGLITAANPAAEKCLQRPKEELVGLELSKLIHSTSHHQSLLKFLVHPRRNEQGFPLDFSLPDGGLLILKCSLETDPNSLESVLVGTTYSPMNQQDHLRWRLALESTDAGFWGYNMKADLMYFSPRFEKMLGYEPGDLAPNWDNLLNTVHPDDRAMVDENVKRFNATPSYSYRYECRLVKKDGSPLWVLAMGTRHQDAAGNDLANGWRLDIHDRKMMELKLLSSEAKSRTLLESLPDIIFVHDREGRYLEVHTNDPGSLMIPKEQLLGMKITELLPNELGQKCYAAILAAIDRRETSTIEYELELPRGPGFFEARISPFDDVSSLIVIRDITENKLTQIAMRESDERLRDFIDNCPAVVYNLRITDEGTYYTFVGGRTEEVFESSAEDLMGRTLLDTSAPFIHPEDALGAQEALKRAISTMSGIQWTGRYVLPSGKIRWINSIGKPRRNEDGTLTFSAISMDVTHERMLAQKVREQ
ncbi:MAG: PAS domain S-box protein, partial [Proteobacteria bacterium]